MQKITIGVANSQMYLAVQSASCYICNKKTNMKKTLLLSVCLVGMFSVRAQQEFAPIGAVWHYHENPFFYSPFTYVRYLSIESVADTMIGDRLCRKLVKNRPVYCTGNHDAEFVYQQGDQVFFYNWAFGEFDLLYDFAAQAGDSWVMRTRRYYFDELQDTTTEFNRIIVDSVSQVVINGLNLRQLHVHWESGEFICSIGPIVFLERIGDLQYLLYQWELWIGGICDTPRPAGLRCYYDPVMGLYETGLAPFCDWVGVSTHEPLGAPEGIRVYPSPASHFLTMENQRHTTVHYRIYNYQGRMMQSGELAGGRQNISIDHLPAGAYHFVFANEDGLLGRLNWLCVR